MQDAFEKWNTTPVIVGINPEPTYITNEPFPAITICNLNQALSAQAAHIANDSGKFAMLQVLCRRKTNSQLARGNNDWEQLISNVSKVLSLSALVLLTIDLFHTDLSAVQRYGNRLSLWRR